MAKEISDTSLLELAIEITVAWLGNPNTRVPSEEIPGTLATLRTTLTKLAAGQASDEDSPATIKMTPAVSVRRSLASKEHIISMIDGKPYKLLKRHLAVHGLTPAQYRERYGLKPDYPMVAENYGAMRRGLAKKLGLGQKPNNKPSPDETSANNTSEATAADKVTVPAQDVESQLPKSNI